MEIRNELVFTQHVGAEFSSIPFKWLSTYWKWIPNPVASRFYLRSCGKTASCYVDSEAVKIFILRRAILTWIVKKRKFICIHKVMPTLGKYFLVEQINGLRDFFFRLHLYVWWYKTYLIKAVETCYSNGSFETSLRRRKISCFRWIRKFVASLGELFCWEIRSMLDLVKSIYRGRW